MAYLLTHLDKVLPCPLREVSEATGALLVADYVLAYEGLLEDEA